MICRKCVDGSGYIKNYEYKNCPDCGSQMTRHTTGNEWLCENCAEWKKLN